MKFDWKKILSEYGKNLFAFKRFEELKKQRPGIKTVIDVEKGKWETT